MMGPSHALSGAAVWLTGSLALDHFAHYGQSPLELAVGTAMCAGGALLPDLDMSGRVTANKGGATVAHTFGVVSLFLAEVLEKLSLGIYDITRLRRDPHLHNGHRTFTHTVPFNVAAGYGVFELCVHFGRRAVVGVLFVTFAMALRGLFANWSKRAGWVIVTVVAGAAAASSYPRLDSGRGYAMLGIAMGVGGLVHLLGDMLTPHGCPVLWPIPTGRRLWRNIGLPESFSVEVGGKVERYGLRVLFTLAGLASVAVLWGPTLLRRYTPHL